MAKAKKRRPWKKWVVTVRLDDEAQAREFAAEIERTGVVHLAQSGEWQQLRAEVASEPHLDPRGSQLQHHQHYLDGERPR